MTVREQYSGYYMLDLHEYTVEQARLAINKAFRVIAECNFREIYIITGRGRHINSNGDRGILKRALPKLLKPYRSLILEMIQEPASMRVVVKRNEVFPICFGPFQLKQVLLTGSEVKQLLDTLASTAKTDSDSLIQYAKILITESSGEYRDLAEGLSILEQAHNDGNKKATYLLGYLYTTGCDGLNTNYKKGLPLLRDAAAAGTLEAHEQLAVCYMVGKGVIHNDQQAIYHLEQAAKNPSCDWVSAQLGIYYCEGIVVARNIEKSIRYLRIAAQAGNANAQVQLARCYACGDGVPNDRHEALELYKKAAKQKHTYAIFMLGYYTECGYAIDRPNKELAYLWYQKGAEYGDMDCIGRCALFKLQGIGTQDDREEGFRELQNLADLNYPDSSYVLGKCYIEGNNVPIDRKKGIELIKKAARYNSIPAHSWLGINYATDPDFQTNRGNAYSHLIKAAADDPAAAFHCSIELFIGKHVQQNFQTAFGILDMAFDDLPENILLGLLKNLLEKALPKEQLIEISKYYIDQCTHEIQEAIALLFIEENIDLDYAEKILIELVNMDFQPAKASLAEYYIKSCHDLKRGLPFAEDAAINSCNPENLRWLGDLYSRHPEYQNFPKAELYLRKAILANDTESMFMLAQLLITNGSDNNLEEAHRLIYIAAQHGLPKAQAVLSEISAREERENPNNTELNNSTCVLF